MFAEAFQHPEHRPFFWQAGEGAALLVHGFPGTPAEMRGMAKILNAQGWTTHGLLLPGFGPEIGMLPEVAMEEWVTAIGTALAALQERHHPVLLVGHSVGGALALQASARQVPDALVLVAPFWRIGHPVFDAVWAVASRLLPEIRPFRFARPDFTDPGFRRSVSEFIPGIDLDDPKVQGQVKAFGVPTSVLEQVRRAGIAGYRSASAVPVIPTLVLQGNVDPVVTPHRTRKLLRRLGGTIEYREVFGGHDLPSMSGPAWPEVSEALTSFGRRVWPHHER